MKALILTLTVLLVGSAPATHAADNKTMLDKNREDYQQQLAKIDADAEAALKQWPAQYLQSLNTLEDKLQAAGDLDAVLAIRKEKDRFSAKKQVSKDAIVEIPQELHDFQVKALNAPDDVEVDRNKQILALAAKYVKTLETLKQSLTQVGQIDQAIVVDGEIDSMKIHPEVVAARLALFMADVAANDEGEGKALPPGLKKGLILYYSFDKNEGGIVTDQSGQGHNGTVQGATWVINGIKGGAYSFDGISDYVRIPYASSLDTGVGTVTAWIRYSANGSDGNNVIFAEGKLGSGDVPYAALHVGATNAAGAFFNTPTRYGYGNRSLNDSQWHFIAWQQTGSGVQISVDGTQQPLSWLMGRDGTYWFDDYAGDVYSIGACLRANNWGYFTGTIDEVRIYDRALSEQEIKQLFDSCRPALKNRTTN